MKYDKNKPFDLEADVVVVVTGAGDQSLYVSGKRVYIHQGPASKAPPSPVFKAAMEELGGVVIEEVDNKVFFATDHQGDRKYQELLKDMEARRVALLKAEDMRQQAESLALAAETLERGY